MRVATSMAYVWIARIMRIKKRMVVWCSKKMDREMDVIVRGAQGKLWLRYMAGTNRVPTYTGVVSMRLSKVQRKKESSANLCGFGTACSQALAHAERRSVRRRFGSGSGISARVRSHQRVSQIERTIALSELALRDGAVLCRTNGVVKNQRAESQSLHCVAGRFGPTADATVWRA
jgi:hypothetical protein